jgi:hypothetical protein
MVAAIQELQSNPELSLRAVAVSEFKVKLSDTMDSSVCVCCETLKTELSDVKLELNSFREIVKVLQEELREVSLTSQQAISNDRVLNEAGIPHPVSVDSEWTTITSHRLKKPGLTNKNPRQTPLTTSNKFGALGNLKNDDISAKSVFPKRNPNSVTNPYVGRRTSLGMRVTRK